MMRIALGWLRRRPSLWLIAPSLPIIALAVWTAPPPMPSYDQSRGEWRASESWLRDRNGRLLQTVRVDFAVRRLEWVPLDQIAPSVREAVLAAEDKRFRSHGGIESRATPRILLDILAAESRRAGPLVLERAYLAVGGGEASSPFKGLLCRRPREGGAHRRADFVGGHT